MSSKKTLVLGYMKDSEPEVWVYDRAANQETVEEARRLASTEGYSVFTFPCYKGWEGRREVLRVARERLLKRADRQLSLL